MHYHVLCGRQGTAISPYSSLSDRWPPRCCYSGPYNRVDSSGVTILMAATILVSVICKWDMSVVFNNELNTYEYCVIYMFNWFLFVICIVWTMNMGAVIYTRVRKWKWLFVNSCECCKSLIRTLNLWTQTRKGKCVHVFWLCWKIMVYQCNMWATGQVNLIILKTIQSITALIIIKHFCLYKIHYIFHPLR